MKKIGMLILFSTLISGCASSSGGLGDLNAYERQVYGNQQKRQASESVSGLQMFNAIVNGLADGLNGTSNDFSYKPPTSSYNSYTPSNAPSGHRSSFGSTYEYDLSNPSDRVRYGADPAAKLRDRLDINPQRRIERNIGQYGGGVLNNNNTPGQLWKNFD
jgi:hypothetical protein